MPTWRDFAPVVFGFVGAAIVFGAVFGARNLVRRARQSLSADWPSVAGTVEDAVVERDGNTVLAQLVYSYEVEGEYYSGRDTHQFVTEDAAYKFVDRWKRRRVFIRYQPRHPQRSVLWKAVNESEAQEQ